MSTANCGKENTFTTIALVLKKLINFRIHTNCDTELKWVDMLLLQAVTLMIRLGKNNSRYFFETFLTK